MARRVLVTGGAGFIGSNIVAELAARGGFEIAVCDRLRAVDGGKWRNLAKHAIDDFIAPEDLSAWLGGRGRDVAIVIHMGAISSTMEADADKIVHINFSLSRDLHDWCAASGRRFIYASSAATYGAGEHGFDDRSDLDFLTALRPLNAYGWSKALFDILVARRAAAAAAPPQSVGLKFFNVYGPNEGHKGAMRSMAAQMWPGVAAGEAVRLFKSCREPWGHGAQERDFVDVRDAAAIALWFVDHADVSGLFNVGSGEARSFNDLARAVFTAAGRPARIDYIDMPEAIRETYQYHTRAPMDRLRAAGYAAPLATIDEGVADYVRRYLSREDPYR